ncbi:hypothetical protein ENSA5_34050 [Enhygromyxa salina]|uniref:Uncharacterized protein n=1 Tax=Enhygromyxa salina TaxID=215803 RepID=A0A2S9XXK9_9BACT|nr:hypothetical protein ENSA5_34050 [Enhygromyxa salina]
MVAACQTLGSYGLLVNAAPPYFVIMGFLSMLSATTVHSQAERASLGSLAAASAG